MKMNDRTKKYLELIPAWELSQGTDENIGQILDELWFFFTEEETEYVKCNIKFYLKDKENE